MPKTLSVCARGIKKCVLFFIMTIAISGVSFSINIKTTENLNTGLPIVAWDFPMQMNGILGYPSLQEHASGIRIKQGGNLPPLCNPCTIFNPATEFPVSPQTPQNDGGAVPGTTWGVKFKSSTDGYIAGIRFYKAGPGSNSNGPFVGDTSHNTVQLWTLDGSLLATAQLTGNSTTPGWTEVDFPVAPLVTANTVYIASYYSSAGTYSETDFYYNSAKVNVSGTLTALAAGDPTGANVNGTANGLFEKAPPNSMPGNGFNNSNYWVDVSFFDANINAIQPSVVYSNPVNGSAGVDVNGDITVTFNKDIDVTTINYGTTIFLRDHLNNLIPATVSYTSSSRTAEINS